MPVARPFENDVASRIDVLIGLASDVVPAPEERTFGVVAT
jgi:hypothetical protein